MGTGISLDDGEERFLDLGDIHLQELVGGEGEFLALVDILDEFVGSQRDYLAHVEGEVGRLHLLLYLPEVPTQHLLHLLYVPRHVTHLLHLLPLHPRHHSQTTLYLPLNR